MTGDRAVITIPSHPKYLSLVRDMTVKMGGINGVDATVMEHIKLAVDEACSNVIRHAYRGDTSRTIVVKYSVTPGGFEVVIEDSGQKANLDFLEGRNLDDVRPGGLGIHFIRRAFDVFEFDEKKKRGNRIRLVRYLKERHENRN